MEITRWHVANGGSNDGRRRSATGRRYKRGRAATLAASSFVIYGRDRAATASLGGTSFGHRGAGFSFCSG